MRWLIIFVTCFVLSCATVNVRPGTPSPPPLAYRTILQPGWVSMNVDGERWLLLSKGMRTIGECETLFGGYWNATYYNHGTSQKHSKYLRKNRDSLYECVTWVEHQALGDFYL
jgi:hypothetical protein